MQDSLPAGGLRLCRAGVEPAGSLQEVSAHVILLSRASPGAISLRRGPPSRISVIRRGCAIGRWTVRVWPVGGVTDMRRGMNTLALQVQEDFGHEPHAGNLYIFRGRRGEVVKTLWHIGLGDLALRHKPGLLLGASSPAIPRRQTQPEIPRRLRRMLTLRLGSCRLSLPEPEHDALLDPEHDHVRNDAENDQHRKRRERSVRLELKIVVEDEVAEALG